MIDHMKMKRRDFDRMPRRAWDQECVCASFVVLPQRQLHDSGYRTFAVAALEVSHPRTMPGMLVSGRSDALDFDGHGGYGIDWHKMNYPRGFAPRAGWSFDILPVSGLLRFWVSGGLIKIGLALSSLEVYKVPKATEGAKP